MQFITVRLNRSQSAFIFGGLGSWAVVSILLALGRQSELMLIGCSACGLWTNPYNAISIELPYPIEVPESDNVI